MAWDDSHNTGPRQNPPDIFTAITQLIVRLKKMFNNAAGHNGGDSDNNSKSPRNFLFIVVLLAVAIIWGLFGIYQLDQQERAVILRLGKYNRTVGPGLHWMPPLLESRTAVNVTKVYTWPHQATMLTEDENIIDVNISVQYLIENADFFVLKVNNPLATLGLAAESALRHVVGESEMDEVIATGRAEIAVNVQERLQRYLNTYQTGIQILQVNIDNAQAPKQVREAFDDVVKAREDKERFINEAKTYANGIVPEARGQAKRQIEEATAYREQVIAQATGDASRFVQLFTEYSKSPKVTRERLYLDAMQEVLGNTSKILVDSKSGSNNIFYLPLDKMMELGRQNSSNSLQLDSTAVQELTRSIKQQLERSNNYKSSRRSSR